MVILSLLRVAFYLSICVIASILLCFFLFKFKEYLYKWQSADVDIKIIGAAPFVVLIVLFIVYDLHDSTEGYFSLVSMMLKIIGISLAIVAAIIAFRNYRRKSGDKLSYLCSSSTQDIVSLILRNEKDKTISIFAIDVVLKSGERIRLVNFFWPIINPLNLSAFETRRIDLGKVHLYSGRNPRDLNIKGIKKLICITANGESVVEKFPIDSLKSKFVEKNKILLANRIRNIASGYENRDVDSSAEYWLYIKEEESIDGESWNDNHVLTGYVLEEIFILTNQSLKYLDNLGRNRLKEYCFSYIHEKKVYGEYNPNKKRIVPPDGEYLINGFFWDSDWERYGQSQQGENHFYYLFLDKIEKIKINNAYD